MTQNSLKTHYAQNPGGAHRVLAMAPSPSQTFFFKYCGAAPQWIRKGGCLPNNIAQWHPTS